MSTTTYRRDTCHDLLVHIIEQSQVSFTAWPVDGSEAFEPEGISAGDVDGAGEGRGPIGMCGIVVGVGYYYCYEPP